MSLLSGNHLRSAGFLDLCLGVRGRADLVRPSFLVAKDRVVRALLVVFSFMGVLGLSSMSWLVSSYWDSALKIVFVKRGSYGEVS